MKQKLLGADAAGMNTGCSTLIIHNKGSLVLFSTLFLLVLQHSAGRAFTARCACIWGSSMRYLLRPSGSPFEIVSSGCKAHREPFCMCFGQAALPRFTAGYGVTSLYKIQLLCKAKHTVQ